MGSSLQWWEKKGPNDIILTNDPVSHFFTYDSVSSYNRDDDETHQVALVHFERESAAKTASLLSSGKTHRVTLL
jgi:hypothetical protein